MSTARRFDSGRRLGRWTAAALMVASFINGLWGFSKIGQVYRTDGSEADVAAAVERAAAGSVVRLPAGTFIWGTNGASLSIRRAITLAGEGPALTRVRLAPTGPTGTNAAVKIGAAAVIRDFSIFGAGRVTVFSTGATSGWRISHVVYEAGTDTAYFCFIERGYGLIDGCELTGGGGSNELIFARGPLDSWQTPDSLGTAENVFVEDCTFNGRGYVCDANANARMVVRYCTITGPMKIDGHGFASNTPRGVREMEIYGNTWTTAVQAVAAIELRGGSGVVFGNRAVNQGPALFWLLLTEYGSTARWPNFHRQFQTPQDYPIKDQIGSGRDAQPPAREPLYLWDNLAAARLHADSATIGWTPAWKTIPAEAIAWYRTQTGNPGARFTLRDIIQADRDYFIASPDSRFDGSSGVGGGTKAQMEAVSGRLAGVGYWVTDEGDWNHRAAPGASGRLYVWDGARWVLHYTPFAYPHPAR